MYKEIKISNDRISAVICSLGAEFKSIMVDGVERLWEGDPNVWAGQAPVLFPICGGLKDGKYLYNGKEYTIPKHGFAQLSEFEVESVDEASATFILRSDKKLKEQYPFDFEFRVIFSIEESVVKVSFETTNIGENTMYYSVGAHEAYACPEGVGGYSLIFEKEEVLERAVVDGNLIEYKTVPVLSGGRELLLKEEFFAKDALVFTNIKSKKVTLKNNATEECVVVDYDCDNLLIWTIPGAKYVCIEPWQGMLDYVDSDYNLAHKKSIIELKSGETHTNTHSITF